MEMDVSGLIGEIKAKQAIGAEDVMTLRKEIWPDGVISADEADLLFEINDLDSHPSEEWLEFFVAAITEYVVNQTEPKGYVSDDNAQWLMQKIDHDGKVESAAELELLVRTMEKATGTPELLQDYVLKQIEDAVLTGKGPTRDGGSLKPGSISDSEVQILRRACYAAGSDGPGRISRNEADMLFRIKDATLESENSKQWPKLFVQLVGNYLMAYGEYDMLCRAEASRLENFMDDNKASVSGFFGRMKDSDIGGTFKNLFNTDIFGSKNTECGHIDAVEQARKLTMIESSWLHGKIQADQNLDPLESELLDFIADELAGTGH
ncbi:hypothetical protein [Parasphingorhabdus sp.]|uniref:hypothetical protein n=1 Tax=Parasphingorhabdus sp. TaxID=2709688 RepID=UPI003A92ABDD